MGVYRPRSLCVTLHSSVVNSEVTDFSYHTSFALWESVLEPNALIIF